MIKLFQDGELGYKETWSKDGKTYQLRDPDKAPTAGQLYMMLGSKMLAIVEPGTGQEFNKGNASWALDLVSQAS